MFGCTLRLITGLRRTVFLSQSGLQPRSHDPASLYMLKSVDVFWSHQSPYCYLSLDRLLALKVEPGIDVVLRPVLPGVLRIPEVFQDTPEIEQRYFDHDVRRTAAFLGVPYGEPRPSPVEMQPGTLFRAAEEQPRIHRLNRLTVAANDQGLGWEFLDQVSRLIWDGSRQGWNKGTALADAIERAGINFRNLEAQAERRAEEYDREIVRNHKMLLASGHWGVPTFVYRGEPFFGQDRFDQLIWAMGLT